MREENYLDLAITVLRTARRPMSPRAIMAAAHRGEIVPTRLFGKAQHKTLHARLSEDILRYGRESRFFRTEPGQFFLSELRSDPTVEDSFKDAFHARRRTRDLLKPAALAFERQFLEQPANHYSDWKELFRSADRAGALRHADPKTANDLVFVWAFSVVRRKNEVLSYRVGRYRDSRNAFTNRKSIGFSEMVGFQDTTLFSVDMGVSECGLNAVLADLDLSRSMFPDAVAQPSISFAVIGLQKLPEPVVLFVLEWECPDWFEPTARRLSLNEVRWIDATIKPNDMEDFEPWSAVAFEAIADLGSRKHVNGKENQLTTDCVLKV